MDANGRELILKDEVYAFVSRSIEILNGRGRGLHEKPYGNALAVEFTHRGIPFLQQPPFPSIGGRSQPENSFPISLLAGGSSWTPKQSIVSPTTNAAR